MDKTLQDHVWSILPKEFKEEVKKMHQEYVEYRKECEANPEKRGANSMAKIICMNTIFGHHNLTSDAEEEDEMLCVSRKDMQFYYQYYKAKRESELSAEQKAYYKGRTKVLLDLFGSKCLPDEGTDCTPVEVGVAENTTTSNIESLEPKSAEPKFKVGDEASYVCSPTLKHKCTVTKVMQNEHSGKWEYNVMFEWGKPGLYIPESDLEPYTEPEETFTDNRKSQCESQYVNLSQDFANCDKCLKSVQKTHPDFGHSRLTIAAMAMQGMLSNTTRFSSYEISDLVRISLNCADALIKEVEKGGDE